jgi:hypothetical protein
LSSWGPKTSKTIKNSRADFYAKTLLSPYREKVKRTVNLKPILMGNWGIKFYQKA